MQKVLACLVVLLAASFALAELPPSAYEKMQSESPEVLRLNVLRVDSSPASPEVTDVTILAEVLKIGRSEQEVQKGDLITIKYQITERPRGWAGPGEVPLPEMNTETVAFLKPIDGTPDYAPAAGAMSFSMF